MYALAQLNTPFSKKKKNKNKNKNPPKCNASVIRVHDFILADLHFLQLTSIS